jgi:hypothetical protein
MLGRRYLVGLLGDLLGICRRSGSSGRGWRYQPLLKMWQDRACYRREIAETWVCPASFSLYCIRRRLANRQTIVGRGGVNRGA